jgi:hypothetical protein
LTIDKFGPKPPTPPRPRSLSTHTRPRRGRANSPSLHRPLIANATIPVRHPSTARPAVSRKTPLGHRPDPVRPLPPRKAIRSRHPRLDTDAARLPTPRLDTKRLSPPAFLAQPRRDRYDSTCHHSPMNSPWNAITLTTPKLFRERPRYDARETRSARSCGDRRDLTEIYPRLCSVFPDSGISVLIIDLRSKFHTPS